MGGRGGGRGGGGGMEIRVGRIGKELITKRKWEKQTKNHLT